MLEKTKLTLTGSSKLTWKIWEGVFPPIPSILFPLLGLKALRRALRTWTSDFFSFLSSPIEQAGAWQRVREQVSPYSEETVPALGPTMRPHCASAGQDWAVSILLCIRVKYTFNFNSEKYCPGYQKLAKHYIANIFFSFSWTEVATINRTTSE